eukprot:218135_1
MATRNGTYIFLWIVISNVYLASTMENIPESQYGVTLGVPVANNYNNRSDAMPNTYYGRIMDGVSRYFAANDTYTQPAANVTVNDTYIGNYANGQQYGLDDEKKSYNANDTNYEYYNATNLDGYNTTNSFEPPLDYEDESVFYITLKAFNNHGPNGSVEISLKAAIRSKLIATMWKGDQTEYEIPLPKVGLTSLELVVGYLNHYENSEPKEVPKPIRSVEMSKNVEEWDANFIDRIGESKDRLFRLILAANYMDISSLLNLACAKVATWLKAKTPDEIRQILMSHD